jgi:hypothetical protein
VCGSLGLRLGGAIVGLGGASWGYMWLDVVRWSSVN